MRKQYFGRFDSAIPEEYLGPGFIFKLDGKEIPWVAIVDTEQGWLKTFAVVGAYPIPTIRSSREDPPVVYTAADFPGREVDCPPDGVLVETLRGKVEIWGPEE